MADDKPKLPGGKTVRWQEIDYPTVYCNIMGLGMTPFDIAVTLGEVGEASPDEVTGIPRVKVLLSPEQAFNLQALLGLAISKYIQANGGLRSGGAVDLVEITRQMEEAQRQG